MNGLRLGSSVRNNFPICWTDDEDRERVTQKGSLGIVTNIDKRETCTIYHIEFSNGGWFLFNPNVDGDAISLA